MAAIWKGAISFGLVTIPVELRSAVKTDRLSFRMLHSEDNSPIKYERVCAADGEPVPWNEIVKGYEYEKGKFVILDDEDFEAAAIESSRTIDILDFVKIEEIDPRYFDKPYFLLPTKGGEKPYALLREAIRETGAVGIGKVVIRQTQHLAAVKTVGDALVLEIMRFAHELVDPETLSFPEKEDLRPQELQMAKQLIENLAETFDASKYTDDYRANLLRVIKAKMKGRKIEVPAAAEPQDTDVIDLMSRLKESLEQGKRKKSSTTVRAKRKSASAREKPAGSTKSGASAKAAQKKSGRSSRRKSA